MFSQFARTTKRMAPQVRRVLIVDAQPASAQVLGELLRHMAQPQIWLAPSNAKALKLAEKVDPQVVFCELQGEKVDGVAFTRALRRGDLPCRKAPVILTTAEAGPAATLAGRDAGAHEVLRKPFTVKDLTRRMEAVTLYPRGWIEAVDYVGPDRRRFNLAEYDGPLKRLTDLDAPPQAVRIGEALKIIFSALGAIERDPKQALRALLAQTTELEAAAAEVCDHRLALANNQLHRHLAETAGLGGVLNSAETRRRAEALLIYAGGREARAA